MESHTGTSAGRDIRLRLAMNEESDAYRRSDCAAKRERAGNRLGFCSPATVPGARRVGRKLRALPAGRASPRPARAASVKPRPVATCRSIPTTI